MTQDASPTTLWHPDISPPYHWLLPAVLYEPQISTIAPVDASALSRLTTLPIELRHQVDEHQRLRETLGDLYRPVQLELFDLAPETQQRIEARITLLPHSDALTRWKLAVADTRRPRTVRTFTPGTSEMRKTFATANEHHFERLDQARLDCHARLASATAEYRRICNLLSTDTCHPNERASLSERAGELERSIDEIHTNLKDVADQHEALWRQLFDSTDWKAQQAVEEASAIGAGSRDRSETHSLTSGFDALRRELSTAWSEGELLIGWRPLIFSKMSHRVRDYLVRLDFIPIEGQRGGEFALFAPTEVVRVVVEELAAAAAEVNGWALMGGAQLHGGPSPVRHDEEPDQHNAVQFLLSVFLLSLPCPHPSTPLEEVVRFRRQHDDELQTARAALGSIVANHLSSADHFQARALDSVSEFAEIERLLTAARIRSHNRLTARARRWAAEPGAAIREVATRAGAAGVSAAAAAFLDEAVHGFNLSVSTIGSVVAGTASVGSCGLLMCKHLSAWERANRAGGHAARDLDRRGLRYLYEVSTEFG